MTIITVTTRQNRLSLAQRRVLAETLTDAVLEPEVGQPAPAARVGFQVHFRELAADSMAIGGKLLSDQERPRDIMTVTIAVMDAAWPAQLRAQVIRNVLARLAEACGLPKPSIRGRACVRYRSRAESPSMFRPRRPRSCVSAALRRRTASILGRAGSEDHRRS